MLLETAKAHKNGGDQGFDCYRTGAQNSCVVKEERRTAPRASRAEQTLPRNLEAREGAEARKHLTKIKESAETGRPPRNQEASISTGVRLRNKRSPKTVRTGFFQDLKTILADQRDVAQSERTHWMELWKNLRMDCAGGMLISTKKLKIVLSNPDQITADVLKALHPNIVKKNYYNVAGLSLEFERVDDSQGTKRQKLRVGVRDWWQT